MLAKGRFVDAKLEIGGLSGRAALEKVDGLVWVAKSRSPWRGEVARPLVRPITAEWPLLKVQRSVASRDDEWQVPTAAVIGPQNLTGSRQS